MDIGLIIKRIVIVVIIIILLNSIGLFLVKKYSKCPDSDNCLQLKTIGVLMGSLAITIFNIFLDFYKAENTFFNTLIIISAFVEIGFSILISCIIFNKKSNRI